uniref:Rab-GAP TBC domain-containing protein n=1 Tax=Ascaris lumbricoides TaxID=6252 RepID=A0A9J2P6U4_ASCLU
MHVSVGPSAVDYTSMRQADEWDDPSADELMQRHRMHSATSASPKSPKRPPLSVMKRGSSIVNSIDNHSSAICTFGRDYVYSLHQNVKSSLLYGKNNVTVALPPDGPPLKGYLSLHQNSPGNVTVKWTPNQLMHSSSQPASATYETSSWDSNWLWRHVINVNVNDIIYIHIHQQSDDSPATIVFVGGDGVQHAPMQFPLGQHVLAFLSCLESGLLPYSRLDPPLWISEQKGKIFPKLRRRTSMSTSDSLTTSSMDDHEMHDYVFRIAPISIPPIEVIEKNNNVDDIVLDQIASPPASPGFEPSAIDRAMARCSSERRTESDSTTDRLVRQNLSSACTSMRAQILARAFYGWLAYCRHLRTVRTHLSRLIESDPIEENIVGPVDETFWQRCRSEKSKPLEREFFLRVYRYGIEGSDPSALRRQAWPYLLGLLNWSENIDDRYRQLTDEYSAAVEEWKKLEKIVRVRDHEAFTAARLRHSSYNGDLNLPMRELSINNDVFEENEENTVENEPPNENNKEEALINDFGANLHRIEKDVDRCDRTSAFFSNDENLSKLKNVMCTHVWRNLTDGYVQGMCDLAAPLLVILEDEPLVLECFDRLMVRMRANFPLGSGMDDNLANMRSLIQVMDPEMFDLMMNNGDFTHLYFCYRWFLLDFKRELTYAQVFRVWEVIWASSRLITPHFQLFFALALLTTYRHIIIDNRMDFTDVIKFFNEMAERHNVDELLDSARCLLERLQALILELKNASK